MRIFLLLSILQNSGAETIDKPIKQGTTLLYVSQTVSVKAFGKRGKNMSASPSGIQYFAGATNSDLAPKYAQTPEIKTAKISAISP